MHGGSTSNTVPSGSVLVVKRTTRHPTLFVLATSTWGVDAAPILVVSVLAALLLYIESRQVSSVTLHVHQRATHCKKIG